MGRRAVEKPGRARTRAWLVVLPLLMFGAADCYSTGDGTPPPLDRLYYPVGLRVSAGGSVLYAVNSDFDLQFNGGTLQSYDLALIRRHTVRLIADPSAPEVPVFDRSQLVDKAGQPLCPDRGAAGATLGEICAPPVDSSFYVRDSAIIGAFATDLLLSPPPSQLEGPEAAGNRSFDRLYTAVRGNASITWASIERDTPSSVAPLDKAIPYGPFILQCGQDSSGRCDTVHQAGSNPDERGNTRHITMPGEPFGMAMSQDGQSIVVTHQNETKTSLFDTGLRRTDNSPGPADVAPPPSIQFVLDDVPFGGVGLAAIPHDRDAFMANPAAFPRQAFLETSRVLPQISLIRQYPDEFNGVTSNQRRPFLDREGAFPVAVGPGGNDSRGIVIDPTPRLACKAKVNKNPVDPAKGRTQAVFDAEIVACARKPARVFVANRSPAALLIGELGGSATASDSYDPDRLQLHTAIPLSAGPSKIYLGPVVEADGALALRVFAVCFDSATVFVFNPETDQVENVIRVGLGPFAMAFDPFTFEDVAANKQVESFNGIRRFRFAYLASFTKSFIQILDLDNFERSPTFERVVFTLGQPTNPKGS
jgi:DNA-binding beta-propeller fold protein YncE